MAHNYIIQWNCRGLRSNREDIELLISKYSPAAICLQETMLTPHQTQTFKHYSAYYKSGIHGHGGVCILVKDKFIHSQVQFQADLQAVAVCITINDKMYTVASVYVPPSGTLNELAFDRMINSFSSRYLILGDFIGHSHLWGANQVNERGKIVEKLIDRHNLILLNDSVHTRFDTYHQTSSLLPPKVLLLCRSWGACVPRRFQRLCQLEFWLLLGTTMLDRLWARGQTKCNTLLMLATSVFGRIHRRPCYVMAQPKSRLDIPWPNDAECTGHVWCHLPCWYPLFCDVESLAGCVGG